jgi:hypothetical protein
MLIEVVLYQETVNDVQDRIKLSITYSTHAKVFTAYLLCPKIKMIRLKSIGYGNKKCYKFK